MHGTGLRKAFINPSLDAAAWLYKLLLIRNPWWDDISPTNAMYIVKNKLTMAQLARA